jgi:hypothetical protein
LLKISLQYIHVLYVWWSFPLRCSCISAELIGSSSGGELFSAEHLGVFIWRGALLSGAPWGLHLGGELFSAERFGVFIWRGALLSGAPWGLHLGGELFSAERFGVFLHLAGSSCYGIGLAQSMLLCEACLNPSPHCRS